MHHGSGPWAGADAKEIRSRMFFRATRFKNIIDKKSFYFPCNWIQIIILNWYKKFRNKIWIENLVLNHNFRLRALITNCLLRSWIWFHAMFLILLSEIAFFCEFLLAINQGDFSPPCTPKRRRLLAVNWVDWKKSLNFCELC